jgi:hypothetical protein
LPDAKAAILDEWKAPARRKSHSASLSDGLFVETELTNFFLPVNNIVGHVRGLNPPMLTPSIHLERSLLQLRSKDKNLEKYIYLSQLKNADESIFFKLLVEHMLVSRHRTAL